MSSLLEAMHERIRAVTSTNRQLTEDLHAFFDIALIASGQLDERVLAYAQTKNSLIFTASAAWNWLLQHDDAFTLTAGRMQLGINLAAPTTYNGAYPFANMMWSSTVWDRYSGSATFTQNQGELAASDGTSVFRSYLSDAGYQWPGGVYTVRNPDGCQIAFGTFGNPTAYAGYDTRTEFDVTLTPSGGNGVFVFVKGSLTNISGPLQVIRKDHYTQFLAGNKFANEFISFHAALHCNPPRFMDWLAASDNIETTWAQRTQPNAISWRNGCANGQVVVPWEVIFDLCNKLNVDAWINIPVRAVQNYIDNVAATAGSILKPTLNVYPERANETWNFGSAWINGAQWTTYMTSTWLVATANAGANTYTYTGHGMITGATVRCFNTPENRIAKFNQPYPYTDIDYRADTAAVCYVEVIDANTFKIYNDVGRTVLLAVGPKQTNLLFTKNAVTNSNNCGDQHIQLWDAFEAVLGASRVKKFLPTQAANTGVTTSRFSNAAAAARATAVSPAPYFNGDYFMAQIVTATGQISPEVWSASNGMPVTYAIYAAGANPTTNEVLAGTGAIAKYSGTCDNANFWRRESAGLALITGLVDGTTYEHFFVFRNMYMLHATIAATASVTTTGIFDSYANQAERMLLNAYYTSPTSGSFDHITASGGKEVWCYEGGPDFNPTKPATGTDFDTWRIPLQESVEYAAANKQAQYIRASQNIKRLCFFADVGQGSFSLADSYADQTDQRFLKMCELNGSVDARTPINPANVIAADLSAEPSYPYNVYTFADTSLTYKIANGSDLDRRFDISGGKLRLINGTGINWTTPVTQSVTILASDGFTIKTFTVKVTTGELASYDTDALAYFARLSVAPGTGFKGLVNNAIVASKAAGLWNTKCDAFYLWCHNNQADALLNLIGNVYNCTISGGLTFTQWSGFTGNGSTGYLDTGFNPTSAPSPKYTLNAAAIIAWCLDNSNTGGYIFGNVGSSNMTLNPRHSGFSDTIRANINSTPGPDQFGDATTSIGMFTLSRTAAGAVAAYRDKTAYGTSSRGADALPNGNITFLRANTTYSTHKLALGVVSGALTSGQKDTLYDIWQPVLAGLGAI